jgi:two-component system, NtrC family, sensor histidine kinase KinB
MKQTQSKTVYTQKKVESLFQISSELAQDLSLKQTLANVLKKSVVAVEAERGGIVTLDEKHEPMDAAIIYHGKFIKQTASQVKDTITHGLAGWVMQEEKAVLIPDTSKDERWCRRPDDSSDQSGAKCAICVPLISRKELVGVLTVVHSNPGFFNEEHLDLIQAIGHLAGVAIYNARLFMRLEKAQKRYQTLFEASSDLLFITDWDGRIIETNRAVEKITNYKPRFSHDAQIMDFHKPDYSSLGAGFSKLKLVNSITYESELLIDVSMPLPVEIKVAHVTIGKQSYLQWVIRDISDRKRLAAMQEDLMTMVYHDIRSPLANVLSSLDILTHQLEKYEDASVKTILSVAHRSAERIMRLVNSLLDIRKIEAGNSILHSDMDSPLQIVEDAMDVCRPMAASKRIILEIVTPKILSDVPVDRDMIRRVVINLIENAIKFSSSNKKVSVGLKQEIDAVVFFVEDNGPGIPEDQLDNVFNKYTRLKTAHTTRGFGLGLAFCKLAVDAHGGKIWAESTIGKGTRFLFSIPVNLQAEMTSKPS